MIRFFDAMVLAHTKLQTHKIRTGIAIGIAGILFGLILGVIFVVQGVFDSLDRFSKEGLNNRSILGIVRFDKAFPVYENLDNDKFIAEVEAEHARIVSSRTAAAKKHQVYYDAKSDNPSPVVIDRHTKKKVIDSEAMGDISVQKVAKEWLARESTPFVIEDFLAPYPSAKILPGNTRVQDDSNKTPQYMKDGKEPVFYDESKKSDQQYMSDVHSTSLLTMNQTMTDPFISKDVKFDSSRGEVPVILPFKAAEKLLKLEPQTGEASMQAKYDRLHEVRSRINEIGVSFCYRSNASEQLLEVAISQQKEQKRNMGSAEYRAPSLIYNLPTEDSCGAVTVAKDTRSAAEKKATENRIAYEKEIGIYIGDPVQHKVNLRAVGVSGDAPSGMSGFSVSNLVQSLLSSWLSYDSWVVPAGLLATVPAESRPEAIFRDTSGIKMGLATLEEYTVEFGSIDEARGLAKKSGGIFGAGAGDFSGGEPSVMPVGSSILVVEELKVMFEKVLLWALLTVGGIAVIILGSIIGRTVSEGRRESAIFRAIGARRVDIGSIYGSYAFLLSVRVMIFALLLGLVVALNVELWIGREATVAAQYAYAAMETSKQFHLIGFGSIFIPVVLVSILVFGMIASVIPVVASARRNPIKDMRDDT